MKDVEYLSTYELEADFITLCNQILIELQPENRKLLETENHWQNIEKMWLRVMEIYFELVDRA